MIDASSWTPQMVREWRVKNPTLDPDKHLCLGDPHTPPTNRLWDAAFGSLGQYNRTGAKRK